MSVGAVAGQAMRSRISSIACPQPVNFVIVRGTTGDRLEEIVPHRSVGTVVDDVVIQLKTGAPVIDVEYGHRSGVSIVEVVPRVCGVVTVANAMDTTTVRRPTHKI